MVTGLGVVAPNAHGAASFAGALREGKSGIRFQPHLAEAGFACCVGGIPEGIEALEAHYLSDEERMAMNRNMVYAAIAALDAWSDAGLTRSPAEGGEVDWGAGAISGRASVAWTRSSRSSRPKWMPGRSGASEARWSSRSCRAGTALGSPACSASATK